DEGHVAPLGRQDRSELGDDAGARYGAPVAWDQAPARQVTALEAAVGEAGALRGAAAAAAGPGLVPVARAGVEAGGRAVPIAVDLAAAAARNEPLAALDAAVPGSAIGKASRARAGRVVVGDVVAGVGLVVAAAREVRPDDGVRVPGRARPVADAHLAV